MATFLPQITSLVWIRPSGHRLFTDQQLHFLHSSEAGVPDGLFSNQKYQFGSILEGLAMENLGIFYYH
jgi:hypothetical protein